MTGTLAWGASCALLSCQVAKLSREPEAMEISICGRYYKSEFWVTHYYFDTFFAGVNLLPATPRHSKKH